MIDLKSKLDELVKKYRTDDSIAVNGENLADIILGSEIDIRNAEALLEWYTRTNYSEFSYDIFVKSNASFAVALADYNLKQDAYNLAYENAADYIQAKSEFDGVEAIANDNGKFCYVPITHKVTLGEIVDLLYKFNEEPNTFSNEFFISSSFGAPLSPLLKLLSLLNWV